MVSKGSIGLNLFDFTDASITTRDSISALCGINWGKKQVIFGLKPVGERSGIDGNGLKPHSYSKIGIIGYVLPPALAGEFRY
ncbi:hypothetical protein DDT91_16125 [Algoriphagus sp. AK58]|nr:hypothetical protein [Algoriphagus sp. AK58]